MPALARMYSQVAEEAPPKKEDRKLVTGLARFPKPGLRLPEGDLLGRLERHQKWLRSKEQNGERFVAKTGEIISGLDLSAFRLETAVLDSATIQDTEIGENPLKAVSAKNAIFIRCNMPVEVADGSDFTDAQFIDCAFDRASFRSIVNTGLTVTNNGVTLPWNHNVEKKDRKYNVRKPKPGKEIEFSSDEIESIKPPVVTVERNFFNMYSAPTPESKPDFASLLGITQDSIDTLGPEPTEAEKKILRIALADDEPKVTRIKTRKKPAASAHTQETTAPQPSDLESAPTAEPDAP